jgi:hypothetical protein
MNAPGNGGDGRRVLSDALAWAAVMWAVAEFASTAERSEVRGRRSEVGDQRSEVKGQRSKVRGQKSEVGRRRRALWRLAVLLPLTLMAKGSSLAIVGGALVVVFWAELRRVGWRRAVLVAYLVGLPAGLWEVGWCARNAAQTGQPLYVNTTLLPADLRLSESPEQRLFSLHLAAFLDGGYHYDGSIRGSYPAAMLTSALYGEYAWSDYTPRWSKLLRYGFLGMLLVLAAGAFVPPQRQTPISSEPAGDATASRGRIAEALAVAERSDPHFHASKARAAVRAALQGLRQVLRRVLPPAPPVPRAAFGVRRHPSLCPSPAAAIPEERSRIEAESRRGIWFISLWLCLFQTALITVYSMRYAYACNQNVRFLAQAFVPFAYLWGLGAGQFWERGGWRGKLALAVIAGAFILGLGEFYRRLLF